MTTSVMQSDSDVATVSSIRTRFPALKRMEGPNPVAFFDGPGGTQVPLDVVNAISDYLLHHNANTHWAYPTSAETDAMLSHSRAVMASFLGARENEISFGANMTTILFHIARAIGRGLNPGDEIIVTEMDHHANIAPWQALAKERGAVLRWVPLDLKTFRHKEGAFETLLSSRTKVVALGMASNILGTITDVAPMLLAARKAGAITVVDAVHYAPHSLVNANELAADFLLCSAYKFYGPHIGVCYGSNEATDALSLPRLEPAPDTVPECLETGTQNHEGIVGAAAAVNFLASLSAPNEASHLRSDSRSEHDVTRQQLHHVFTDLHARGSRLLELMWEGLSSVQGVTLFGPPPGTARTPTVSFAVKGVPSEQVAIALASRGVYLSHGDFYATTVAERLGYGVEGLVRAGCACYTSADEVERLLDGIREVAKR